MLRYILALILLLPIYPPAAGQAIETSDIRLSTGVHNYSELKTLSPADLNFISVAYRAINGDSGGGVFAFSVANLSREVSADRQEGIYVAPGHDVSGASGAWIRQYSGAINVKWFGAAGDGVTDDTAEISSALNSVNPSGQTILLPDGTYLISSTLTIKSRTSLVGTKATLKMAPGFGDSMRLMVNENTTPGYYIDRDIVLEGITFDGNGNGQGVEKRNRSVGMVDIKYAINVTVNNCVFKNIGYIGLVLHSCRVQQIINSEFTDIGFDGFDINPGPSIWLSSTNASYLAQDVLITNNYIHDNYWVVHVSARRVIITNNRIFNNIESGLYLPYDNIKGTYVSEFLTVSNNIIDGVTAKIIAAAGIETHAKNSVFSNNVIRNTDHRSFHGHALENVIITGNSMSNAGREGTGKADNIGLVSSTDKGYCKNVMIYGNRFFDDQITPTTTSAVAAFSNSTPTIDQAEYCQIFGNDTTNTTWVSGMVYNLNPASWNSSTCIVKENSTMSQLPK